MKSFIKSIVLATVLGVALNASASVAVRVLGQNTDGQKLILVSYPVEPREPSDDPDGLGLPPNMPLQTPGSKPPVVNVQSAAELRGIVKAAEATGESIFVVVPSEVDITSL